MVQQPSTFKVYNASAGSGKTFTLVKEYLKVLLQNPDPNYFRHILAVTFTNKAAAEMKARVITNLKTFSKSEILQDKTSMFQQLEEELSITDIVLHQRSQKILKSILNNYAAFNITTIDSFTYRLIRSFAFDLGLSGNFDVEMDAKGLLNEAVDALLNKIGEDEDLTRVLIEFALDKTNEDKSWDIGLELREIAELLLNENDRFHVKRLKEKSLSDFLSLKNNLLNKQKELTKELRETGKKGLNLIDTLQIDHKDFYRAMLPNHFKNLVSDIDKAKFFDENTLRTKVSEGEFYPKSKSDEVKLAIDSISDQLAELYYTSEKLYQQYSLANLFSKSLVPLAVLSSINGSLDELKEEKNIRLNAEFNELISKNIQEQPVAYIYERIGERFRHYFIDEMQDTSQLQWQNLIPLISNALSQEGTSLLLVGDTKQSIYRWRGGEPEQFSKLASDGSTEAHNPFFIPKDLIPLDTNYRSYNEIIHFNNSFFQHIAGFFNKQEYARVYAHENKQEPNEKTGGFVQLSFINENLKGVEKDEAYVNKVLEIITKVNTQYRLNEICILTRTRKQGITIADYLAKEGIEIISSETLLLQNSARVLFIVDLLRHLQNKNDKEAKFNVLYFLHEHKNITEDKHTFIGKLLLEQYSIFKALRLYGINFDELVFYQLSLYESLEHIIRSFGLNDPADAYLQFFLDEVLQFSQRKSTDINSFLEYWDEKKDSLSIVVPEEKNAVRIMTIHKSKGLEFPVVIYPYDLDIYKEQNPKVWYPILDDESDYNTFDSLLVNCNKKLENSGEIGRYLYNSQRDELELDNFNLLYVAFTRAIEQLYVIVEDKKINGKLRTSSQFLKHYLEAVHKWDDGTKDYTFGSTERKSIQTESEIQSVELGRLTSTTWQSHNITIVPVSSVLWDADTEKAVSYGNLIHEILALIKTQDDIEGAVEQYINKGLVTPDTRSEIIVLLKSIISHELLKTYYQQNLTILNEREFLTGEGEIVIPDRVVMNEKNETVIIDYKTGIPLTEHKKQLEKYAKVVSTLQGSITKKILVYIGESITIEEV